MTESPRRAPREKGGALLTVLWLSAALAAIAFSVATEVRSETDRVSAPTTSPPARSNGPSSG
jgi:type II secretory pathway component PulK